MFPRYLHIDRLVDVPTPVAFPWPVSLNALLIVSQMLVQGVDCFGHCALFPSRVDTLAVRVEAEDTVSGQVWTTWGVCNGIESTPGKASIVSVIDMSDRATYS